MPNIRAVHPTDLIRLIAFLRDASLSEVTARVWPDVRGDSDARGLRTMLPRLLARPGSSTQAWAIFGKRDIRGLAIAGPRAGKLAWDVEYLLISGGDRTVGVDLLDHMASEAVERGARKIFVAVPSTGEMTRIVSQAGFRNFTSESLYVAQLPTSLTETGHAPARPRLRRDSQALYRLYNAAVPCRVRSVEAMTMEEWAALEKGARLWAPSLAGNRQQLVWEQGGELVAWLKVTFGSRSQHLEMLVHPGRVSDAEQMVLYALAQVSHRVPVYFTLRDYQPEVRSLLERHGFSHAEDYLVFVRELAARVPARGLVPARA